MSGGLNGGLLPEGRLAGPMPWVIGIMTLLMILAAAGGIALHRAAEGLGDGLASRMTVQIVEANPDERERQARRAQHELSMLTDVLTVERVGDKQMADLLKPWLGAAASNGEMPIPILIDVTTRNGAEPSAIDAALRRVAPSAVVDTQAKWLSPLSDLLDMLRTLAIALILMMGAATAGSVVLAARSALNTHRATIEIMHLMGATDTQIARLFERRAAKDAMIGGIVGGLAGVVIVALLSHAIRQASVAMFQYGSLGLSGWAVIILLPFGAVVLTVLSARLTVTRALGAAL